MNTVLTSGGHRTSLPAAFRGAAAVGLIRGVVFDLDDTLYLERDYVASGFRAVAAFLAGGDPVGEGPAASAGVPARGGPDAAELCAFLWRRFQAGRRGDHFDHLLASYPTLSRRFRVDDLVAVYRSHEPELVLPPETGDTVAALRDAGLRLGLISDGPLEAQQAKWAALGLASHFAPVFFTDVWSRRCWKPHPRAFGAVARAWQLRSAAMVYVGDNPYKDFLAPRRLGWHTVRIRRSGQLWCAHDPPDPAHAPDLELPCISDLPRALVRLAATAGGKPRTKGDRP